MTHFIALYVFFGAHHVNLNEDKPLLSAEKCSPVTLNFWQYKVYADIPEVS